MNKKLLLAASILTISGALAACGASEKSNEETKTETAEEQETASVTSENESPAKETEGEQTAENPAISEGTPTIDESQSYEISVLSGYELAPEEPNKDVLYFNENDAAFMRIETFNSDESDFASATEAMQQSVQASNTIANVKELPSFENPAFTNSSVIEIPTDEGKVTGAVFEKDSLIVKLTIFDRPEIDATEDFLNMGKTITAK